MRRTALAALALLIPIAACATPGGEGITASTGAFDEKSDRLQIYGLNSASSGWKEADTPRRERLERGGD